MLLGLESLVLGESMGCRHTSFGFEALGCRDIIVLPIGGSPLPLVDVLGKLLRKKESLERDRALHCTHSRTQFL